MRVVSAIKWLVISVVAAAIVVTAAVIALQEPIPPAGTVSTKSNRVYDDSYVDTIADVGEQLDAYRQSLVSPSVSVAVGIDGVLVWADARGFSDIDSQTLATPDIVYAIGSVSKPVTAILTAVLWQSGQLDLDVDVREYVPNFPKKAHAFTLRQLLSHQAGIRHYRFAWSLPVLSESSINREFATTAESLSLFENDPLLFEQRR